jgi:hypothetical protein
MKRQRLASVGLVVVLAMVVGGCAFLESELNTGLDSDQEPRLGLREYEPIIW